jgi:hypothetical protein
VILENDPSNIMDPYLDLIRFEFESAMNSINKSNYIIYQLIK